MHALTHLKQYKNKAAAEQLKRQQLEAQLSSQQLVASPNHLAPPTEWKPLNGSASVSSNASSTDEPAPEVEPDIDPSEDEYIDAIAPGEGPPLHCVACGRGSMPFYLQEEEVAWHCEGERHTSTIVCFIRCTTQDGSCAIGCSQHEAPCVQKQVHRHSAC